MSFKMIDEQHATKCHLWEVKLWIYSIGEESKKTRGEMEEEMSWFTCVFSQVWISNVCNVFTMVIFVSNKANLIPIQFLYQTIHWYCLVKLCFAHRGPSPNGRKAIGWRFAFSSAENLIKSTLSPFIIKLESNLSGMNFSGSDQIVLSWWRAYTGTLTMIPFGIR